MICKIVIGAVSYVVLSSAFAVFVGKCIGVGMGTLPKRT